MKKNKKIALGFLNPLLLQPKIDLPKEITVIGAGTIGPDIGYYLKSSLLDIKLNIVDIKKEALKTSRNRLEIYVDKAIKLKKMQKVQAEKVLNNINYTTDYEDMRNSDLIIEAVTEDLKLKQEIFSIVESFVNTKAIITSNTSSIPAHRIFNFMKNPQRATVTHFFAPAWRNLAVEVINWEKIDKEVLEYLYWFFAYTGKVPFLTADVVCFMLDRIFDNWCNEAVKSLDIANADQIDKIVEEFVNAGPFFVLNIANGNPIIIETNNLQMEEGYCYKPASILSSVSKWKVSFPGKKLVENLENLKVDIKDRLLGVIFSQSFDIVDRNIGNKSDLNLGTQIALGFKKGSLELISNFGEKEVKRITKKFDKICPGYPSMKSNFSFYKKFYRHVQVDTIEDVKIITIRRPQFMNALNEEVTNEILEVLKVHVDDVNIAGFIITGYGKKAFSAGADIGNFTTMLGNKEAATNYAKECAKVQEFIDKMKKPIIAAVNGITLGGGLEIVLRCHSILAVSYASFGFPEITLGILPGIGGCIVPYRRWLKGAQVFHEMLCLGRKISAAEAFEIGMISYIAKDYKSLILNSIKEIKRIQGILPSIREKAVDLPKIWIPEDPKCGELRLSYEAIEIVKDTIYRGSLANTLKEALEIGYNGFGKATCSSAAKEGISSFLEKRSPNYV